jgi:hypothetical protein
MQQPTPYPQAGGPQAWQPPTARPQLSSRQKRGAAIAGIVGFNVLSIGFWLLITPILIGAFGLIAGFVLRQARREDFEPNFDLRQFERFIDAINPEAWVPALVIAAILGLALMVAAVFASHRILRAHNVHRPWPVTWSAIGIAIVASWILSTIGSIFWQIVSAIFSAGPADIGALVGITAAISILLALVVNSAIGWLSWWWMAHAMRAPHGTALPSSSA